MRRTEYLITELRNSTDNADSAIKDAEIISYLNYGQKLIQNIIFKKNPKADIFKKKIVYPYVSSGEYVLPDDVLAVNAISLVEVKSGEDFRGIDRIDESERIPGYHTEDKNLIIRGYENQEVRVTVFRDLPKMDRRWGKIQTVNPGASLVLSDHDTAASSTDEWVSVVDKFGTQKRAGIYIDDFSDATWETTDPLTGVAVNDFVCMGKNSVNCSELPDACEIYLLDYARQRIYTRNNYEDAGKQVYFTDKQEADISSLFSNNQKDTIFLPYQDDVC